MERGSPEMPKHPPLRAGTLGWSEVERRIDRARTLRAVHVYDLAARALGQLARALLPARRGSRTLPRPLLVLGLAAAAFAIPTEVPRAQEKIQMSAGERSGDRDAAALAELGLDFGALDACVDVSLLWRAVRDLVLPGKVSEPTQQRILRRVWAVDPDIRPGSFVDWAAN